MSRAVFSEARRLADQRRRLLAGDFEINETDFKALERIQAELEALDDEEIQPFKFEGLAVGDRIQAFDFEPMEGRPKRYFIGKILRVERDGTQEAPYAFYLVKVEVDAMHSPGVRLTVRVPMETSMDYDGRIRLL